MNHSASKLQWIHPASRVVSAFAVAGAIGAIRGDALHGGRGHFATGSDGVEPRGSASVEAKGGPEALNTLVSLQVSLGGTFKGSNLKAEGPDTGGPSAQLGKSI